MATVVSVMDRGGFEERTDNIVVVQADRRRLLWVPRDVWSDTTGNRINTAFRDGGHDLLMSSLADLGLAVDHSVCLPRDLVESLLAEATVTVPVAEPLHLWYPLRPTSRIEDGRKPVDFLPPREVLSGERIHQWLGARYGRDPAALSSDFDRIARQQTFVRALLRQRFDFAAALRQPVAPSLSDPAALADLRRVRHRWTMATTDQVVDRTLDDGRRVLALRSPEPTPPPRRPSPLARLRPLRT